MRNEIVHAARETLPDYNPAVIFDVGANVGQSAVEFRAAFPDARILSFEPVPATFAKLQEQTRALNIECHAVALGRSAGSVRMTVKGTGTGNRVVSGASKHPTDIVEMATGDAFAASQGVSQIDLLKIDAEGLDLDVLCGFHTMLAEHRIDLLQVECSLSPEFRRSDDISVFRGFLEPLGYRLMGIYGQVRRRGSPALAIRGDGVFVSTTAAKRFEERVAASA